MNGQDLALTKKLIDKYGGGTVSDDQLNSAIDKKIADGTIASGEQLETNTTQLEEHLANHPSGDKVVTTSEKVNSLEDNNPNYLLNVGNLTYGETVPTLFATKNTKYKNGNKTPSTEAFLFYNGNEILISRGGTAENLVKLCDWNTTIADGLPLVNYSPILTEEEDIIFVYRCETVNNSTRKNPIFYDHTNYSNPQVIELGEIKPTSWFGNVGAEHIVTDTKDYVMFAEYTRPWCGTSAYVWKVTKPFSNASNWTRVFEKSPIVASGLKHFHTINYDPYSNTVFTATGDDGTASAIYKTKDDGETWELCLGDSERQARLMNFIFTQDGAYWGSDCYKADKHCLMKIPRKSDGELDFVNKIELCDLPTIGGRATYCTAYIEKPHGLLLLDFHDINDTIPMSMLFWSFKTNSLHNIGNIRGSSNVNLGFRCDAINYYQGYNSNKIYCGWGFKENLITSVNGDSITSRLKNMSLEVLGCDYEIKSLNENGEVFIPQTNSKAVFVQGAKTLDVLLMEIEQRLNAVESGVGTATYGEIVLNKTTETVNEGTSTTFTVKLDKAPSNNQTVSLSSNNNDVALNISNVTFTPANYNIEQTITVTIANDSDINDDNCIITCSSYSVSSKTFTLTITDTTEEGGEILPPVNGLIYNWDWNDYSENGSWIDKVSGKTITVTNVTKNNGIALNTTSSSLICSDNAFGTFDLTNAKIIIECSLSDVTSNITQRLFTLDKYTVGYQGTSKTLIVGNPTSTTVGHKTKTFNTSFTADTFYTIEFSGDLTNNSQILKVNGVSVSENSNFNNVVRNPLNSLCLGSRFNDSLERTHSYSITIKSIKIYNSAT